MLPKSTIFALALFQVFIWGIFLSAPVQAFAKTIYVEEDGDNSNDGSSESPYKTLEKAAEEVNEGEADEVRIGKGKFDGGVTFEESVTIEGEGKNDTTISGTLSFKKKAKMEKVSIRTTAHTAVTIGKDAQATFKDIDIREFIGIGIIIVSGGGELTVQDSRIGASSGKGIYAEAGSKLTVTGSSIVSNKQEGLDIRNNTRGTIKNNVIEGNKESGIELILGSSDFIISGNKIKNNNASGIAFQFYEIAKKQGTITVSGNTISGSRKYGIDCNKPQAGNTPAGYWADSITLEENSFSSNKLVDVSTSCKIIEAKTEEEEKALEQQFLQEEKVEVEAEVKPAETDLLVAEKAHQEKWLMEDLVMKIEGVVDENQYQGLVGKVQQLYFAQLVWTRWEHPALKALEEQILIDSNELLVYKEQLLAVPSYANRPDLQQRVTAAEQKLMAYQVVLDAAKNKKFFATPHIPAGMITTVANFLYGIIF